MKLDVSSLAHTKWECKYHIVFAPKYRGQIIYGKIKQDIGQMLRKLCEYKGIMLLGAKQETSRLLGEDAEERQVRQLIAHKRQEQHRNSISKRKRSDPER